MLMIVEAVEVALQMTSHRGKTMVVLTVMVGRADCQQWEQRHCIE